MKSAVQQARLGVDERMHALKRLDDQARRLEKSASGPSFDAFVAMREINRFPSADALCSDGKAMRSRADGELRGRIG